MTRACAEPRKQDIYVLYLTIVQLVWTNKKITRTNTDYTLKQTDNTDYTIIAATAYNGAPRQHHKDVLFLNMFKLS